MLTNNVLKLLLLIAFFVSTFLSKSKAQNLGLVRSLSQSHDVLSISFLNDGKTLVSGGDDRRSGGDVLRFWDVKTGRLKHSITLPLAEATSVIFSPNSRHMARGSWEYVALFDARTGKLKKKLKPLGEIILSTPVFSPKGDLVASGGGSPAPNSAQVDIWNVKTGRVVRTFKALAPVVFSADGKAIVTNDVESRRLMLWDVNTGRRKMIFGKHGEMVDSVVLLPRNIVVSSSKNYLKFWSMKSGKLQRTLRVKKGSEYIAFSPNGKLLLIGRNEYLSKSDRWHSEVNFWNVTTGKMIRSIENTGPVAFSPDGRLAVTAKSKIINVWQVNY